MKEYVNHLYTYITAPLLSFFRGDRVAIPRIQAFRDEPYLSLMHEIRNPLNSLLGAARLLSVSQTAEERRRCVEIIVSSEKALRGLLERSCKGNTEVADSIATTGASKANRRVLVADDMDDNRFILKTLLKRMGFQVDEAGDGHQAMKLLSKHSYCHVFMDLEMPEVDGFKAVSEFRSWEKNKQRARTPVSALTAYAAAQTRLDCERVGFDNFLTKPILAKDLERLLSHDANHEKKNHYATQ